VFEALIMYAFARSSRRSVFNGPSLDQKELSEVVNFLLAVIARFKAFKTVHVFCRQTTPACVCVQGHMMMMSFNCSYRNKNEPTAIYPSLGYSPSSVLSELSGLENVVCNDFMDDVLDSEYVSEQRASASLPDSVPIELEEERAAREADEMAALDAVGDYEADATVMLEDVPKDIVIKILKVWCAWVSVLVFSRVCVCVCV
jgi:hypothetical protein